jgi:hypothetical protein
MIVECKSFLLENAADWELPGDGEWTFFFHNNFHSHHSNVNDEGFPRTPGSDARVRKSPAGLCVLPSMGAETTALRLAREILDALDARGSRCTPLQVFASQFAIHDRCGFVDAPIDSRREPRPDRGPTQPLGIGTN